MESASTKADIAATARAALDAGRLDEAEAAVRDILSMRPHEPNALHLMGRVELARRRPQLAIDWITRALSVQPDAAESHFLLGTTLAKLDRLDESVSSLRRATALAPGNVAVWRNLGICLTRLRQFDEAEECLDRALALDPDNPARHHDLAILDLEQGNVSAAERRLADVLRRSPDHLEARIALGRLCLQQADYKRAATHLQYAVQHTPEDTVMHLDFARACREAGRLEEAAQAYQCVLATDPASSKALIGLAIMRTREGQVAEAANLYERALEQDPGNAAALGNLAGLRQFAPGDAQIAQMIRVAGRDDLDTSHKIQLEFAIGKALDDVGDYDGAFAHYATANHIAERSESFDGDELKARVDRFIETFEAAYFAHRRGWGAPSNVPVFIVGMGRSGTSLTEQILATHPQVFGAGEIDEIERCVNELRRNTAIDTHRNGRCESPEAARRLGQTYLDCMRGKAPGAARIIDKMPLNFQYLGFIATILPGARIVHCRRDPLDTCLSLYFQHFADSQPYAYDLTHLGTYYREYRRLMDHWRRVLPLPMLDLEYEALVQNQERESRRLIEFCGLDWDERCLAFYETDRRIGTASVWQVRQPIYSRSVGRWRHYEAHLGPLKDALGMT